MCHITPFSWNKSAAFLIFFRVKRCYMTYNIFYIFQNDYNNTVLGDKMYHLTDSAFFFVLKKVLFVK